jgi:Rrf2 family protein
MFRISRRLDYGLHMMLALAQNNKNQPQSTASLSKKLGMPLPFMHQIAHALMQSGLIKATPGPRGGLRLNQAAESISVLNIVEALEGPILLNPCQDCSDSSPRQESCLAHSAWDELQQKIVLHLESITLESLLADKDQYIFPVSVSMRTVNPSD